LPVGAVRLEGVVFGHDPAHPVLRSVDLEIAPGSRAALVGASGSGKSTILSLVLRLARPQAGRVLLGGRDLADVPEPQLRATVGAVFQDNYLFNTSVAENIRLARPGASDDDVRAAAAGAELHDLVVAMPEGYETVVGEGGARLSGGQRQRVAIARLLLRDPQVMVFDEPTSALDAATEAAITATLSRATRGRTSITVTHRLAVVADADCIHVVDAGRIVESGTHEGLLAAGGAYADLWRKQTGFTLDGGGGAVEPQRLRDVPIFAELDEAALEAAAALFVRTDAAAGRLVIRQGDPGDRFFILVRGQCDVLLDGAPGTEARVVARLEDGDHFGEVALLRREPRVASVRARTDSVFLTLHAAQFRQLLDATPGLAERLDRIHERRVADRFPIEPEPEEVSPG
jgi:ATP-binding cassette subfamily B protein